MKYYMYPINFEVRSASTVVYNNGFWKVKKSQETLSFWFNKVLSISQAGLLKERFNKDKQQHYMGNNYQIIVVMLWVSIVMTLTSCGTPEYLNEEELKAYVVDEDNHLTRFNESKGFRLQATYRPTDLLIAQELGSVQPVDSSELSRLKKKYQDYHYFVLSLSKENKEALYQSGGGFNQFSDLVQTLSFRMSEYVNLVTSEQDTIPVGDYIYPRTYGMGGATTLMFAFNKEKTKDMDWVQLNLEEFGMGIGPQQFRFETQYLENIPRIDFKIATLSPHQGGQYNPIQKGNTQAVNRDNSYKEQQ
ncbi:MAG: hypothetical protein AAFX87_30430 [Bacteroidota bacterium]